MPARFQVAPAGEAVSNGTFESLTASRDGRSVFAGMEEPLAPDGRDAEGRGRNRILRYTGFSGHDYRVASQYAYKTDPGLSLVELAWVNPQQLVSMERTFVPDVGNTIRVFSVSLRHATDVTAAASLKDAPAKVFVQKKLLFDLVNCPPSGATALQPQPNPLLDNVEALALGGNLPGGRRQLYLLSDDNNGPKQITRFYSLAVDLHVKQHCAYARDRGGCRCDRAELCRQAGRGGYEVAVFASDLPLETTSSVAGAIWHPFLSAGDRVAGWARTSYDEFAKLAGAEPSVQLRHGRELPVERTPDPAWADVLPDLTAGGVAADRIRGRVGVHDAGGRDAAVLAVLGEAA